MSVDTFVAIHPDDVDPVEVGNGIVLRRLYRSGPEPTAPTGGELFVYYPQG